jgi:hypothetical protein
MQAPYKNVSIEVEKDAGELFFKIALGWIKDEM